MNYYPIDEVAAKRANDANSYRDYVSGSETEKYRKAVDRAEAIAEKAKHEVDSMYHEKIDYYLDMYARKLADNLNAGYRIDASAPSILVAGGGNFPVRKKEKQNAARDRNFAEYKEVQGIIEKIRSIGHGGIMSDDKNAIAKLEKKLECLERDQARMKAINAFYRKNKTLDGCPDLTEEQRLKLKADMARSFHLEDKPYPSFELTNNGANIRRIKERIESLKKEAERAETQPQAEKEFDGYTLRENTKNCRIQFLFDSKPDENVRTVLKSYGFRWAPSEKAWQRILNDNGRMAAKSVIQQLEAMV